MIIDYDDDDDDDHDAADDDDGADDDDLHLHLPTAAEVGPEESDLDVDDEE